MAAIPMTMRQLNSGHYAFCSRFRRTLRCSNRDNAEYAQVKVPVGPVGDLCEQTFHVRKKLGSSSNVLVVSLPKPMGIVFELSKIAKDRIFISELVPNSFADRSYRVNQLSAIQKSSTGKVIYGGCVKVGDLLLATTTVNVVVDLFGLRSPQRVITLFDVHGRRWSETMAAIQSTYIADGPTTLILERETYNT